MKILLNLILSVFLSIIVSVVTVFVLNKYFLEKKTEDVLSIKATPVPTPLVKYEIESLQSQKTLEKKLTLGEIINEEENYTSYKFNLEFKPDFENKKNMSGLINIPKENKKYPIALMIRGYVDKEIYSIGMGSTNASKFFANNGFITVSPDFLGYGDSDQEALNVFESRFQTYTTLIDLINSFSDIKQWDGKTINIWAHSNGGQIALTYLVISGESYPTVLWAPVTKSFPYSVLYFTEELPDKGKYLRRELAKIEELYNVEKFSFTNYLDKITAPIQIHQGGLDDAVPAEWSLDFFSKLKNLNKDVEYFYYPNSDHNLSQDWNKAISRSFEFFELTNSK